MAARLDPTKLIWPLLGLLAVGLGAAAGVDPQLAVAGALGIAFVLIVLADLTLGVVAFAVISFLALLPNLAGPALSLPKLTGLLLAMSWLATVATRERRATTFPLHPALAAALIAFLAWSALSVIWSESHHAAVSATYRYALNLMLFPIVLSALTRRREAVWIVAAFVAGATIAAAYGFVLRPNASLAAEAAGGSTELDRVSGTIGDPNELAAVLVAGLILATSLFRVWRASPILQAAAAGGAGLCLATLLLTLSRGGLVALGAALVVGVIVGGRWRSTYALVAVGAVAAVVIYFGAIASPADRTRVSQADGGSGRTDIWKVGWRMVHAKPVLGAGSGNFPVSSVHYVLEAGALPRSDLIVDQQQVAHNLYLAVLSELGVVGLALFLGIIGGSIHFALKAARTFRRIGDASLELLCRGVVIALCGLLAADFFLSAEYSKQLWLLLALGPALYSLARRSEVDATA